MEEQHYGKKSTLGLVAGDPYRYINGVRSDQYQFDFDKKIGTLKSANLAIGTSLKSKKKKTNPMIAIKEVKKN